MSDHQSIPHANYLLVFIALCVLTAISWGTDLVELSSKAVLVVIVLAVAVFKAQFVMLYFMHLKFEGRWKYLLLTPTVILAMGLPLALLPDIGVHYYTTISAPRQEVSAPATEGMTQPNASKPDH